MAKNQEYEKIKCAYCKHVFIPTEDDVFYVGKVKCYYCPNCGEEGQSNLKIK